jgi:hypothetical protein
VSKKERERERERERRGKRKKEVRNERERNPAIQTVRERTGITFAGTDGILGKTAAA